MKLKTPIVVDGREVKDVTVTESTFDDIAQIGAPEDAATTAEKMTMMKKYISRCTGLPEEAVGRLKASDAIVLLTKVTDFFTVAE